MRFGRVEGIVERIPDREGALQLRVFLDTGNTWQTVRDEIVAALTTEMTVPDLCWTADQYTQETIGINLALDGWEVIGAGNIPDVEVGELARSATYAVRQV